MTLPPPAFWVPAGILAGAAVWDLAKREVPDLFPVLLVTWAVVARLAGWQRADWGLAALGLLAGLLLGLLLFALGALGGGDGKLLAGVGAVLGLLALGTTLPWIAVAGGVMALVARARGDREVCYAPAIAVGYAVAILL